MAKYRTINTKFWDDNYISNLYPLEKLLFLYFLTNPLTNIVGIYEISMKRIVFDTKINKKRIDKILQKFEADNKMIYRNEWIYIKNFIKNQLLNPKVVKGIQNALKAIPSYIFDSLSIDSLSYPIHSLSYPIHRLPQSESESESESKSKSKDHISLDHISISKKEIKAKKEKSQKNLTDEEFIQTLKGNPAFKEIDIDRELAKMDAWFLTPRGRGRKKTRRFIVNWLNKCEPPILLKEESRHDEIYVAKPLPEISEEEKINPEDIKKFTSALGFKETIRSLRLDIEDEKKTLQHKPTEKEVKRKKQLKEQLEKIGE